MLKTPYTRFKWVAFFEGSSFLILLFICMPLKYGFDLPYPNKIFGMLHGLLTVLYLFALIEFTVNYKVHWTKAILFLIASLVPFGTFFAERKWLRPIGALHGEY